MLVPTLCDATFHAIAELRVSAMADDNARKIYVAVNERGQRIGETHHKAVLTDHEVDLLLDLHDQGFGYGWLAKKFEVSKSCVAQICRGEFRLQRPSQWRAVYTKGRKDGDE